MSLKDAEFGIRLCALGYGVYMIDFYTLEEAPLSVGAWLRERSQRIKGLVQTIFTFLKLKREIIGDEFQAISNDLYFYWYFNL